MSCRSYSAIVSGPSTADRTPSQPETKYEPSTAPLSNSHGPEQNSAPINNDMVTLFKMLSTMNLNNFNLDSLKDIQSGQDLKNEVNVNIETLKLASHDGSVVTTLTVSPSIEQRIKDMDLHQMDGQTQKKVTCRVNGLDSEENTCGWRSFYENNNGIFLMPSPLWAPQIHGVMGINTQRLLFINPTETFLLFDVGKSVTHQDLVDMLYDGGIACEIKEDQLRHVIKRISDPNLKLVPLQMEIVECQNDLPGINLTTQLETVKSNNEINRWDIPSTVTNTGSHYSYEVKANSIYGNKTGQFNHRDETRILYKLHDQILEEDAQLWLKVPFKEVKDELKQYRPVQRPNLPGNWYNIPLPNRNLVVLDNPWHQVLVRNFKNWIHSEILIVEDPQSDFCLINKEYLDKLLAKQESIYTYSNICFEQNHLRMVFRLHGANGKEDTEAVLEHLKTQQLWEPTAPATLRVKMKLTYILTPFKTPQKV